MEKLKAQSTAKFLGWTEDGIRYRLEADCHSRVTGWVDAQNGFGAMIRSNWITEFASGQYNGHEFKLLNASISGR